MIGKKMAVVGRQNQLEYFLQGSVGKESVNTLLHRLRGLCDGASRQFATFVDHEILFTLGSPGSSVSLRGRHSLDDPKAPWQLRYVGQSEMGDKSRSTLLRSCVEVSTSDNLTTFLKELGFRYESEYVLKGYYFVKGHMRITVSQVCRVGSINDPQSSQPISDSYLVEISLMTTVQQDSMAEEIKAFAEHLKPLVHLEKIDHRKLQTT
ncbi:Mediator of RNA polymerase II transcription subunit 18 [Desmophyllum pertusum]|uniref:Mediator of RNA polymerase II transcription subunit 18 n=1 Tax=Desmophyllum pertusum TaxID=174260 RepID=A0A9X0A554_9CNID|nr:Mediator of RNA polymerase II transcription subunit 18 [Desmophyllum pertusum]